MARTSPFLLESALTSSDVDYLRSIDAPLNRWLEVFNMLLWRLADRAAAKETRSLSSAQLRQGSELDGEEDAMSVNTDDVQEGEEDSAAVQSMFDELEQEAKVDGGGEMDQAASGLVRIVEALKLKVEHQDMMIAELIEKVNN